MERKKSFFYLWLLLATILVMISACGWMPSKGLRTQAEDSEGSNSSSLIGAADSIQRPEGIAVSYNRFNIATIDNNQTNVLTSSNRDFKPVSSSDGKYLVFFRVVTYGNGTFETWKTKICVINYDGGGFRELTSGSYADYNPTFMRDGTNRIVFNRYNRHGRGRSEIYMTTPEASPGEEQKISHPTIPAYEWVYSSLKDGRLFIHRIQTAQREVYLLKPNPGGLGEYQRISMPTTNYIHKANISPSETKITYMFDNDNNGATYNDVQIAWSKFDVDGLRVYDQKLITAYDTKTIEEYPKWSPDETLIIYDSNKMYGGGNIFQLYAYRLSDGAEKNISPDKNLNCQLSSVRGLPK